MDTMDDSDVLGDAEVISTHHEYGPFGETEIASPNMGSFFNFANRLPSSRAWHCFTDLLFCIGGSQRWCQDAASNDEFGGEDQAMLKHVFLLARIKVFDGFLWMLLRFHHLILG